MSRPSRTRFWTQLALFLFTLGCADRNVRGRSTKAADGLTYLSIEDDNGGKCGPIIVDGKPWPHPLKVAGPISPGTHQLKCGSDIAISIEAGTIFHFDYWGP